MQSDQAQAILGKYIKNKNLVKHGMAVGYVMQHFADIYHEDAEYWGVIGLLYDVDYELYPDEHCTKCVEILTAENVPADMIKSIQSTATDLARKSSLNISWKKSYIQLTS